MLAVAPLCRRRRQHEADPGRAGERGLPMLRQVPAADAHGPSQVGEVAARGTLQVTADEMQAEADRLWQVILDNPCNVTLHHYRWFWLELAKHQRLLDEEPLFRREWAL